MLRNQNHTLWIVFYVLVTITAAYAGDPWRGRWIWDDPQAHKEPQPAGDRFFRYSFDLSADALQGHTLIMADNAFVLFINGEEIARGEGWWPPVELDIAQHLSAGRNVIAIRATNTGGQAGLFFECTLKTRQGELRHLLTDGHWRVTTKQVANWNTTPFDDAAWPRADVLGKMGTGLWGNRGKPAWRNTTVYEGRPLTPEESRQRFMVPEGFEVQLLAAEPDVVNPVVMALDEQGRMIVAEAHTYRWRAEKSPVLPPRNPVIRLAPDADGRWRRDAVVAQGFSDPIMGIAIRENRIWLAALDRVLVGDLQPDGTASNLTPIIKDAFQAWNPFGMFQLSFGPDGYLYQIIGNHPIELTDADGTTLKTRGSTGAFFRFRPDGTDLELLAQGMRAPFTFDADPFGRWWLISNGESNPNRMILMIPTVDYHYQTRHGPWDWLSGAHPWSPPVTEMERGSITQIVCYQDSAYPEKYWNALFTANWGAHGVASVNHKIDLYTPKRNGEIENVEVFLDSTDAMFRPTQLLPSPDGHLYMLDWYGLDDENDLTGRIYKIVYTGDDRIAPLRKIPFDVGPNVTPEENRALLAIQSRNRAQREEAAQFLASRQSDALVETMLQILRADRDPFISAQLLWVLQRMGTPAALDAVSATVQTKHAPLRAMVVRLLRDWDPPDLEARVAFLEKDQDPETRVEVALCAKSPEERASKLFGALAMGARSDRRLRYQCAAELSRIQPREPIFYLLHSPNPDISRIGWIALDVGLLENTNPAVAEALNLALRKPPEGTIDDLLYLGRQWPDAIQLPSLQAFAKRDTFTATQLEQLFKLLGRFGPEAMGELSDSVLPTYLDNVATGQLRLNSGEKQAALALIERYDVGHIGGELIDRWLSDAQADVRIRALETMKNAGWRYPDLYTRVWSTALDPLRDHRERLAAISALTMQDTAPVDAWSTLLNDSDAVIARMGWRAVRWFVGDTAVRELVLTKARNRQGLDAISSGELGVTLRAFNAPEALVDELKIPAPLSLEAYSSIRGTLLERLPDASVELGRKAFGQLGCASCHEVAGQRVTYGPSLKGIGGATTADYLVESVLLPSRVIKDGFDVEAVTLADGDRLEGVVEAREDVLIIRRGVGDTVEVPADEVARREKVDRSPMPELLLDSVSMDELADLLAYLVAQGGNPQAPVIGRAAR